MTAGDVIERGVVNGMSYRVWRRRHDGKKYVYTGDDSKRHNLRWLEKQKKKQLAKPSRAETFSGYATECEYQATTGGSGGE